jgi:hypothetical protein
MGEAGQDIWDSLKVLWTGSPMYPFNTAGNPYNLLSWTVSYSYTDTNGVTTTTNLSGPNSPTVLHHGSGGFWHFQIRDYWGNPMSAGTIITVDGGGAVKTIGDLSTKLPDTWAGANGVTAWGVTDFTVGIYDAHAATDPPEAKTYILTVKIVHPIYGESGFTLASGTVY